MKTDNLGKINKRLGKLLGKYFFIAFFCIKGALIPKIKPKNKP
jgi:hypothetical protein